MEPPAVKRRRKACPTSNSIPKHMKTEVTGVGSKLFCQVSQKKGDNNNNEINEHLVSFVYALIFMQFEAVLV